MGTVKTEVKELKKLATGNIHRPHIARDWCFLLPQRHMVGGYVSPAPDPSATLTHALLLPQLVSQNVLFCLFNATSRRMGNGSFVACRTSPPPFVCSQHEN